MRREKDFTQGPLFRDIIIFSLPLIFTNILQTLFNMTDVAVLGNFASAEALGSVGSTSILVFLCTGIISGFGSAVNAVTAFYIGAKRDKDISETVHTSVIVCLLTGIAICVLGNIFAPLILRAMNTQPVLIDGAVLYLRIYMAGFPALALYNAGNGILSAEGDTKSPLIFLFVSGFFNVVLDLLFVIAFRWDIAGVAIASVVSLYISAALILVKLFRKKDALALKISLLRPVRAKVVRLTRIGLPSGLQYAIFSFANIFLQVGVNSFSAETVIANSAASNADNLVFNVMTAFYVACSTFVAQNYGAHKRDRVLKSYLIPVFLAFFSALALGSLLIPFGRAFLSVFTSESAIIDIGMRRFHVMAFSFCLSAFMDGSIAASRGLGRTAVPTAAVITGSCIFRIVWIYTVFAHFRTLEVLYLLFPVSWVITAVFETAYFLYLYRKIIPPSPPS